MGIHVGALCTEKQENNVLEYAAWCCVLGAISSGGVGLAVGMSLLLRAPIVVNTEVLVGVVGSFFGFGAMGIGAYKVNNCLRAHRNVTQPPEEVLTQPPTQVEYGTERQPLVDAAMK